MEGMSFIVVRSAYLTGGDSGGRNAVYFQIENEKPQTIQIVNVGDSLSYTLFPDAGLAGLRPDFH